MGQSEELISFKDSQLCWAEGDEEVGARCVVPVPCRRPRAVGDGADASPLPDLRDGALREHAPARPAEEELRPPPARGLQRHGALPHVGQG